MRSGKISENVLKRSVLKQIKTKREEIIDYIFEKYGNNHTAHIITFSKIKAKQAIRDIGRVFNVDLNIINKICKNIKPEFEDNIIDAIVNENK